MNRAKMFREETLKEEAMMSTNRTDKQRSLPVSLAATTVPPGANGSLCFQVSTYRNGTNL